MALNKPKRSEVWLVDFDDVRKDEVGKIRPALIIQDDDINKHYTSTIVVPFTTAIVAESEPLRVNYTLSFLDEPSDLIIPQIRAYIKYKASQKAWQYSVIRNVQNIPIYRTNPMSQIIPNLTFKIHLEAGVFQMLATLQKYSKKRAHKIQYRGCIYARVNNQMIINKKGKKATPTSRFFDEGKNYLKIKRYKL